MSATRAKFKCQSVLTTESGRNVTLQPVIGGSEENEKFFSYTPSGSIELGILNPDVKMEVGKEYYVDFTEA